MPYTLAAGAKIADGERQSTASACNRCRELSKATDATVTHWYGKAYGGRTSVVSRLSRSQRAAGRPQSKGEQAAGTMAQT